MLGKEVHKVNSIFAVEQNIVFLLNRIVSGQLTGIVPEQ